MGGILGIDEAGRGPVIGPLVLAGVHVDRAKLQSLAALGVRDSKQLSRGERTTLAREIRQVALDVRLIPFAPRQLGQNLNRVELSGMARLIHDIGPDSVYLDAPVGPRGISGYLLRLKEQLAKEGRREKRWEIFAENGADRRYPIVSAASIVAKVYRDEAIKRLHQLYGDFGWGYPLEPKTRRFLRDWYSDHRRFPACVRVRWRTVRTIVTESEAGGLLADEG